MKLPAKTNYRSKSELVSQEEKGRKIKKTSDVKGLINLRLGQKNRTPFLPPFPYDAKTKEGATAALC